MRAKTRGLVAGGTMIAALNASMAVDLVTRWNEHALTIIRRERVAPPVASRALAMTHLALLGGATAASVAPRGMVWPVGASEEFRSAATACAAHEVLNVLFPVEKEFCDQELTAMLAAIPDGSAKREGIVAGQRVGREVVEARAADGSADVVEFRPGTRAGEWRPTPPGFLPALLPQWGAVRPFALTSSSQFRRSGAPELASAEYAEAYDEVRRLGSKEGSLRTMDETEIARFWADGAGTETPPGHWNSIARSISERQGLSLIENARLFAVLNVALADAAIVAWDMKYVESFWRPVTAIQLGDTDGNEATDADPSWEPLLTTPPFPSYTSGHSTFSAAAATVLARFFGRDDIAFESASDALPGVTRRFGGFWEAAEEAGASRTYGGIHFAFDNVDGLEAGRTLGDWVWVCFGRPRFKR